MTPLSRPANTFTPAASCSGCALCLAWDPAGWCWVLPDTGQVHSLQVFPGLETVTLQHGRMINIIMSKKKIQKKLRGKTLTDCA